MMRRWINPEKQRYYQVHLVKDLFNDWSLITCWGSLNSHRGGMRSTALASHNDGLERIKMIDKRRKQRGYHTSEEMGWKWFIKIRNYQRSGTLSTAKYANMMMSSTSAEVQ